MSICWLHTCKLSLQETSYRLRPASEVIRTAYGTAAELANLSVILLNKAGVEEHFLLSAYRPQNMNAMGLSGLLALSTSSYKSSLQTYMTLTDLEAHPLTVESNDLTIDQHDTLHISEKNVKHLADRYQSIALPVSGQLAYLYAYAHNRSIKENLLLPKKADCRYETIIPLADTLTYIPQNNKEIKNQWGHVSFQYTVEGKNLKVMRKIKIEQQLLTPSNFADFYKLISEWKDENNHLILFTH